MVLCGIDLNDVLSSLSTALDFTYSGLSEHHKRVAYISLLLGKQLGLSGSKIKNLYFAAILHDIGAITLEEKSNLAYLDINDPFKHCELGYEFVQKINFLQQVSYLIKTHHHRWDGKNPDSLRGEQIPVESRIIHVADRLDVLIDNNHYILEQTEEILNKLKTISGDILDPYILQDLLHLSGRESFWLDLTSDFLINLIDKQLEDADMMAENNVMMDIALLFAKVIDSKSKFTYRHSQLVSSVAVKLASLMGFKKDELEKIVVAGLLHDLGKLSIPEKVLEKPGKLTPSEFRIIKRHTYYTFRILEQISCLRQINEWASYHHERLDGKGYPFHIPGDDLSLGARILSVSDVYAALTEDRPYRSGLGRDKVERIFKGLVQENALDGEIVAVLLSYYNDFRQIKQFGGE